MGARPHSRTSGTHPETSPVVYTDGACSGNPGPGGWAWAELDGAWASGFEPETTNQRMELTAAIEACERFEGPLRIVSDSTYVVNCWRDRWWEGWLKRGWKNSQKKLVANRDLWERLVPHFRDRGDLELAWVKGHSGDEWNDIVDRLAVAAVQRRAGATGESRPSEADLGPADEPVGAPTGSSGGAAQRDSRVPAGHVLVVTGLRSESLRSDPRTAAALAAVIEAQAELHPDLVVLSGLRPGAEELGAAVASASGVPMVAVLPYPDPTSGWPERERARFADALDAAREVVVLERSRPSDLAGRRASLSRSRRLDAWRRRSGGGADRRPRRGRGGVATPVGAGAR